MRPGPIVAASVFLVLLGATTFVALAVPSTRQFLPLTWAIATALQASITGLGLWYMKRWAVIFFAVTWVLFGIGALMFDAGFNWSSLIGLGVVCLLGMAYWRRLTW